MTHETDNRSPDEIERDIRATQDDMSRTVEQIEGEFNGRNILNALLDKADQGGVDTHYLIDSARRNPIALGMIAMGGLWLVSDADARPSALGLRKGGSGKANDEAGKGQDHEGLHPEHRSYVEHMARCEPQPGEDDASYRRRRDHSRASYFMIEQGHNEDEGSFRNRLDEAGEYLRRRRDQASEGAHKLSVQSRERAQQAVSGAKEFYTENPLVSGLAAAFVGAIAGAALPSTRTEEAYVGELGEQAIGTARDKAEQVGEDMRHRKDEMVDAMDQTLSGGDNSDHEGGTIKSPELTGNR